MATATPQQRAKDLTARLVHDVGKYLCRTARNLPPATGDGDAVLSGPLLALLLADLYGPTGGPRPSQRFAAVAPELALLLDAERRVILAQVGTDLSLLEALEPQVRAGTGVAIGAAQRLALGIDAALRGLWRGLNEPASGRRRG